MASKREQVIQAVVKLVKKALPYADVVRNQARPASPGPGGTVVIRDGDPGEPDVMLSPLTYTYDHLVVLEVAAYESASKSSEEVLDEMLANIGRQAEADRTLGGLCEHLEPEAPDTENLSAPGAETGRWADAGLRATYSTSNPLT